MERIANPARVERLMRAVIDDLQLDLRDIAVLTEAASGPFAVTPLIAALAGASRVVAVGRDSTYGSFADVKAFIDGWAARLGIGDRLSVTGDPPIRHAASCQLVTNLGFVRPIDRDAIERLPADAAISLMFEPWECRDEDIDLAALEERGIPILGTNEAHPRLNVFPYVGMVVLKLMFEAGLEVLNSRVVVIGSRRFGDQAAQALAAAGAWVTRIDPLTDLPPRDAALRPRFAEADAVVLAEYGTHAEILGGRTGVPFHWLAGMDCAIVHVCGQLDFDEFDRRGLRKFPPHRTRPGFMAANASYAGPRPVVDLHGGGLKVGELLVRGMRRFGSATKAKESALQNHIALDF